MVELRFQAQTIKVKINKFEFNLKLDKFKKGGDYPNHMEKDSIVPY